MDISSAIYWVVPDLSKALAVLSDTTVRKSSVNQEDLKPYRKSEKSTHFSRWSTSLLFTSFLKEYNNHRKKINWVVDFCCRPLSPIVILTGYQWDSPTIWKTILLQIYKVQLVWMKVQANSSLELPSEHNQDQMPLANQGS